MKLLSRLVAALALSLGLSATAAAQAHAPITVGIVGWPLDPADALHALVSDIEDCLTSRIRDVAPEVSIMPQRAVRDALFPLLEPATQPQDEQAFAKMLARDDVRARLNAHGLRNLIVFAGATRRDDWHGPFLCGAGYGGGGCMGFAWRSEDTALDAALWSLDGSPTMHREAAKVESTSIVPAFVLPVPIMAQTRTEACHELGTRIANAIRESAAQRAAAPEPPEAPTD